MPNECDLVPVYDSEDSDYSDVYGEYWCHTCEQYVDEPCQED